MKSVLRLATLALLVASNGCGGLSFVDSPTNLPVPPSLAKRTLFEDSSIIQYDLELLVGFVLQRDGQGEKWARREGILPDGYTGKLVLIDDGKFYSSIVDRSVAYTSSGIIPILSVAASLDAKSRIELTIEDSAMMMVQDIPWAKLRAYEKNNPRSENQERVWVQSVMLTKMYLKKATQINASGTVSGAAYSAGGKVYNANSSMQRQSFITMLLVDLNRLDDFPIPNTSYNGPNQMGVTEIRAIEAQMGGKNNAMDPKVAQRIRDSLSVYRALRIGPGEIDFTRSGD